ncbi:MAG: cell division protein FtsL [Rhizomicrobium sp.]
MIRVLNYLCVALMGLSILALYHVSERTRIAEMQLAKVNHEIVGTRSGISVLQAEWERVAGPARIQELAQQDGMSDTSSVELSSFAMLPPRDAPLNNSPLRDASAVAPRPARAALQPTLRPEPISDLSGFQER